MSIPFRVHQIWVQGGGGTMPPHIRLMTEWVEEGVRREGGTYRLWNEEEILPLHVSFPGLLQVYRSAPSYAAKSDILRLLVLWRHGGIYLDTDMLLLQPKMLPWLIADSASIELILPYMREDTDETLLGVNLVCGIPINNCFVAAPPQSRFILDLLTTIAQSPVFDAQRQHPMKWTLDHTGPLKYMEMFATGFPDSVRLIPRSLIQQTEGVDEKDILSSLPKQVQGLRAEYPTAILLHGQDRSWFVPFARWTSIWHLHILFWARKHPTLLMLIAVGMFLVCVGLSIRLLKK